MKKIAILTMGVRLKDEKGYTRFGYLAEFLTGMGYQVDLITTTFQHWEKAQRDLKKIKKDVKAGTYPYKLRFIYEPGYRKNIDPLRVISHRMAAKNLKKMLEKGPSDGKDYDLIYAEIPTTLSPPPACPAAAPTPGRGRFPWPTTGSSFWTSCPSSPRRCWRSSASRWSATCCSIR